MARRKNSRVRESKLHHGMGHGEAAFHEQLARSMLEVRGLPATTDGPPTMAKSLINILNGQGEIHRLSFEVDPSQVNNMGGVYRHKYRLVPDTLLKRIAIQDSLVSTIVRGRQEQLAVFGRPRPTRFDNGFVIEPKPGATDGWDQDQKDELDNRIERGIKLLATCGHTEGLPDHHQRTLSEWLSLSVRSAIVVGRIATEVTYYEDEDQPGDKKFHHFVAVDAGTIYRAGSDQSSIEAIRRQAFHELQQLAGDHKLTKEPKDHDHEYVWVQVIENQPHQAFTNDELKVYNFYPVPDVEMDGYPVTPIDTVISAITTHINITTHNKLYFQSGRATRGMLVINSDDATPHTVDIIKQHFNASINNVNNSWRMPVFGCGQDEKITWTPIDSGGGRDMEFQYLTDMNAREILSAFMMSPDELPGWAYLSKGTNNQSLSESNNEYKLEAARDLGIRPILAKFEDFINIHLLPLIDPELAKHAVVRLRGLDADNAEKEAVRTEQDMGIWMDYDDVLERVEKKPLGPSLGGAFPLNQLVGQIIKENLTFGQIQEAFFGVKDASKDPKLAFYQNPMWFQWVQLQQQQQQMEQQAQAAAQGQPPGGGEDGGGGSEGGGGEGGGDDKGGDDGGGGGGGAKAFPAQTENQKSAAAQDASASGDAADLGKALDQAAGILGKSEAQWPADKRRLLSLQKKTIQQAMAGWEADLKDFQAEIAGVAAHHAPKR